MNIFEKITKNKTRFESDKGLLTIEQIWDLPLSKLDKIARAVNSELKSLTEESFVEITPNPLKSELKLKLDALKHVIAVKLTEKDESKKRVERIQKRKALLEALESKENEELQSMSKEEILKKLEELD